MAQPQHHFAFEEYLAFERQAEEKHEYDNGRILDLSGGSEPHSFLSGNAIFTLRSVFRSCRVYDSNLRLYIPRWIAAFTRTP